VPPEIKPTTALSLRIYERMKEKGLSVHQLADSTDVVYETMRMIVTGQRPPGKLRLREICRVLSLDFEETNDMLIIEQVKRKFGRVPSGTQTKDPELRKIEEIWPFLLPEEKEHISWLVVQLTEKRSRKREDSSTSARIAPRPVRPS
jgi:transcriptional regulator with XRE-family HTH domain